MTPGAPVAVTVGAAASPRSTRLRRPGLARFRRDRSALVGLVIVVALALGGALAPVLAPHDPLRQDTAHRREPPSGAHLLGTDELGRDVLSRVLYGARLTLGTTLAVVVAVTLIGLTVGVLAGYLGGAVDMAASRVMDVVLAFPAFLLALGALGVLGKGRSHLMVAIIAVSWASYARVVRSAVLVERNQLYVQAARALGASRAWTAVHHLVPNVVGPVLVLATLDLGGVLLAISAFSFLGLGSPPPAPEWGSMLATAQAHIGSSPFMMVPPGAAIFLTALGFNLIGDGLRDALDPRTGAEVEAIGLPVSSRSAWGARRSRGR